MKKKKKEPSSFGHWPFSRQSGRNIYLQIELSIESSKQIAQNFGWWWDKKGAAVLEDDLIQARAQFVVATPSHILTQGVLVGKQVEVPPDTNSGAVLIRVGQLDHGCIRGAGQSQGL